MPKIRGLTARIAYAQAELHQRIERLPPMSFQGAVATPALRRALACRQAKALGFAECTEVVTPPALFLAAPALLEAWRAGYAQRIDTLQGWRDQCQALWRDTAQTSGGCGYEWFQQAFSRGVDDLLATRVPPVLHEQALAAIMDLDYLTPAQRQVQAEAMEADGFCYHGIERDCCPAGCGDRDIGDED